MRDLRSAVCEFIGTAFLTLAVVGSGIMGERLAGGNAALVLLCNSLVTGSALVSLILTFSSSSGAHFNPLVSVHAAIHRQISWERVSGYVVAQVTGALFGVGMANVLFGLSPFVPSPHVRSGGRLFLSEILATFGLIVAIQFSRKHPQVVALAVAAYITGAYWFFPSTSFANPALTIARALTNTFSGIRPFDVPAFCAAQIIGAALATAFSFWITGTRDV